MKLDKEKAQENKEKKDGHKQNKQKMAKQKLGPSLPQDGLLFPKIVNELPNITLHL